MNISKVTKVIDSYDRKNFASKLKGFVKKLWKKFSVSVTSSSKSYSLKTSSVIVSEKHGEKARTDPCKPLSFRQIDCNPLQPRFSSINADDEENKVVLREKPENKLLNTQTRDSVAGHADKLVSSGSCIAKVTAEAEYDVYQNRASNGLDAIIPKTKLAEYLTLDEQRAVKNLEGAVGENEKMLIMEKAGAIIANKNKRELDIKIGSSTASSAQLKHTGSPKLKARMKKARHQILDAITKSNKNQYRLEGMSINGNKPSMSRISLSRESVNNIYDALNIPGDKRSENIGKVINELRNIHSILVEADITFVASSVLIVIDEKNPDNTTVKLIDLAHSIKKGECETYQKTKERFLLGVECLIEDIKEMKLQNMSL